MLKLLRSFVANLATILFALILAVVVWVTAVRTDDPIETRIFEVPVQLVNYGDNVFGAAADENTVRIEVAGPVSELETVNESDFVAIIDLAPLDFGTNTNVPIVIQFEQENITIASQFPETATVTMDRFLSREIPVFVNTRGSVARGHEISEIVYGPQTIQVSGIESRVQAVAEARVTVLLDSDRSNLVLSRRPTFYDQDGNVIGTSGLDVSATEIEITIAINQLDGFAEVPVIVQWSGEPAAGYRLLNVNNEPKSVLVSGSPDALDALGSLQTEEINITGLTRTLTDTFPLIVPEGITLDSVQPIVVVMEIEPIPSSSVLAIVPEIRALEPGLTVTLDVEVVRVVLAGPLPVLESLEEDDVRVSLDMLGLDVGTHSIEPNVIVTASGLEVRSTQPALVTAIITDVITTTEGITDTLNITDTVTITGTNTIQTYAFTYLTGGTAAASPLHFPLIHYLAWPRPLILLAS